MSFESSEVRIAVVGLGYVGLPLAVAFGQSSFAPIIGFDINEKRVADLGHGIDANADVPIELLRMARIEFIADSTALRRANFIIVAVPTPVTDANVPDLDLMKQVSHMIGKHMERGTTIVYESTVYPGVTEDVCVPIIEEVSGLTCGTDWFVGYSPERTNPGDYEHTIDKVVKVVSGMDAPTLDRIAHVYGVVCKAGVFRAANIKTAEAEKVIENIQRDLNIALMNELSLIFHRLGIHTKDVIDAAGTKWNFHKYQPGLVGGHCIGVDPYYLTHRAQELGYTPQIILAGRRINDWMSEYLADLTIRGLVEAGKVVQGSRVLVLGLTFKEDIRDTRNSKIKDTIARLKTYGVHVLGHDPNLTVESVQRFGVEYVPDLHAMEKVDAVVLATVHKEFKAMRLEDVCHLCNANGDGRGVIIDVKSYFLDAVRAQQATDCPVIYKSL